MTRLLALWFKISKMPLTLENPPTSQSLEAMGRVEGSRGSCVPLLAVDVACRRAAGKGALFTVGFHSRVALPLGDSSGQLGASETCIPAGWALSMGCRTVNLVPKVLKPPALQTGLRTKEP